MVCLPLRGVGRVTAGGRERVIHLDGRRGRQDGVLTFTRVQEDRERICRPFLESIPLA